MSRMRLVAERRAKSGRRRRMDPGRRAAAASRRLGVERLEPRWALTFCNPSCLSIELLPDFDQFGSQIETIQSYGEGLDARISYSIYDTGASVVTLSAHDQLLFDLLGSPVPIKVPGGAVADAIGGPLVGDVSEPGVILADGLHALVIGDDLFDVQIDFSHAARVEGVQVFVGTSNGSPVLPTIVGVPIHSPSPTQPNGVAARMEMAAYGFDFGALFPEFPEFQGLVIYLPDVWFVEPRQPLGFSDDPTVTPPIRVPLDLLGADNHLDPGDEITYTHNPVQSNVYLQHQSGGAPTESSDNVFLFDTGAQLSVISERIAADLGLDLNNPQFSIAVQGAAGSAVIPGYNIERLQVPIDNNGDGVFDGGLEFTDVPIFVLDLVPELDGILGMNLFNLAETLLYDPYDPAGPSLQVRFFTDLFREPLDPDIIGTIDLVSAAFPPLAAAIGGQSLPGFVLDTVVSAEVLGRHVFYNGSEFDGGDPGAGLFDDLAIAADKSALRPGQAASFANYTSYQHGLTGVMVDISRLPIGAQLSAADFSFRVGNDSDPTGWDEAPAPSEISVRLGAGVGGSDRVTLVWPPGEIVNTWLEVTVRPTAATGLSAPDVFYFGNAVGDTGLGGPAVNVTDFVGVRDNPRTFFDPATIGDPFDINRDRLVNAVDLLLVRDHATNFQSELVLIEPPPAAAPLMGQLVPTGVDQRIGRWPTRFVRSEPAETASATSIESSLSTSLLLSGERRAATGDLAGERTLVRLDESRTSVRDDARRQAAVDSLLAAVAGDRARPAASLHAISLAANRDRRDPLLDPDFAEGDLAAGELPDMPR